MPTPTLTCIAGVWRKPRAQGAAISQSPGTRLPHSSHSANLIMAAKERARIITAMTRDLTMLAGRENANKLGAN